MGKISCQEQRSTWKYMYTNHHANDSCGTLHAIYHVCSVNMMAGLSKFRPQQTTAKGKMRDGCIILTTVGEPVCFLCAVPAEWNCGARGAVFFFFCRYTISVKYSTKHYSFGTYRYSPWALVGLWVQMTPLFLVAPLKETTRSHMWVTAPWGAW